MAGPSTRDPANLLDRAIASGRIHSAYLLSGAREPAREAALRFAQGLACSATAGTRPCEACPACRRSGVGRGDGEKVAIDGTGKKGPLYRHVGEHPDLFWLERGESDTRVRIGQVRAIQRALRLAANEGGWRVVVVADAEWLNQEAQNALLRLLEEPPERTCLVLVTASSAGLLATIRSRCQKIAFRGRGGGEDDAERAEEADALAGRFEGLGRADLPDLLDWAEEFRGERAAAADRARSLLRAGSGWLRARVDDAVRGGSGHVEPELDAFRVLSQCRKDLDQRNANPQMVVERALLAVHRAVSS